MSDRLHSVYRFYAADNTLLYVGRTGLGIGRLKQHSLSTAWWGDVRLIGMEHFEDADEAADREQHLIEQLAPIHNRVFRPLPEPPTDPFSGDVAA